MLVLALASCKKVIDVKETDFVGGDIALKTVENNEQGVVGAYSLLGNEQAILLNATFADEVKRGEFYNAGTTHEWQYTSTDIGLRDNFTALNIFYRAIDRVNRVLQALPKSDSTRTGDNKLRDQLKGEALFIRAFSHFELYRFYSGASDPNALAMVYMEEPSIKSTTRIAVGPYFDKLKADLTAAKALLPSAASTEAQTLRANKLAVAGLQARIALYLKQWDDAITYSTEYINALPLASKTEFPDIWTDAKVTEVAFKLKRSATSLGYLRFDAGTTATTRLGSLFRATSTSATSIGSVTWVVSDKLWSSFDQTNDIRFASYLKDESVLSSASPARPSHIVKKYAGGAYGTATENLVDAKIFRTGEMYLIRAEAKAEKNDLAGAAADLNAIRAARITGYVTGVFASKDALITAIMDERFKELAFEGHRFWDLRRRSLPVVRLASDAPAASATTLPGGNFRFVLPIPNAEVQANPTIQQNTGYTN
ncbi:hypothetical protein SY85_18800 [Flavisolibacter tropicus]|uniref:Carbohydrate-binding protein SusD n=2 Tax=Flavisolibacter tropicus TaxID=1492898 RepID=A0A172TYP9_9BACT|nr:hypothetical protein SY85_18800 [Flavisolibacter tropicus]